MTEINEETFLIKLYEVIKKLSGIAKTQSFRFEQKWEENLSKLQKDPHVIRPIPIEKDKFLQDIDYRIQVLKAVEEATVDGFYAIKSLLEALYHNYFKSEEFKKEYLNRDAIVLKYLVAKEILGNLIQYNKMDHETVPLKYNIMARNYTMIKLSGIDEVEILQNLKKLKISLSEEKLIKIMKSIEEDGIISITEENQHYHFEIKNPLELSPEALKKYNATLYPLVAWPTQFWRSFYNIRELNFTPPNDIKYRDFLSSILSRSATQGFGPTNYVFKNLRKYFEKRKRQD
ncbi:MAG: hypothetical protein BAJALOKI2v1_940001 [Promethearchaeota archaeon]|nr:MAG: hypothetical protein BAJALOKI2v1_940001 [Candidatus Lokiarchaeota archaeon]